jgi:hypothetical protein
MSFLSEGADVNGEATDGQTALKIAQKQGYKETADLLRARWAKE